MTTLLITPDNHPIHRFKREWWMIRMWIKGKYNRVMDGSNDAWTISVWRRMKLHPIHLCSIATPTSICGILVDFPAEGPPSGFCSRTRPLGSPKLPDIILLLWSTSWPPILSGSNWWCRDDTGSWSWSRWRRWSGPGIAGASSLCSRASWCAPPSSRNADRYIEQLTGSFPYYDLGYHVGDRILGYYMVSASWWSWYCFG